MDDWWAESDRLQKTIKEQSVVNQNLQDVIDTHDDNDAEKNIEFNKLQKGMKLLKTHV